MVGVGGFFGAIARFWLGGWISNRMGIRFPYGTFVINVTGCLLIGFILTVLTERTHLHPYWRYLVPVGFIGGYTTFSSFEYETLQTIREGDFSVAAAYVLFSVLLGFVAVWLGALLAKALP